MSRDIVLVAKLEKTKKKSNWLSSYDVNKSQQREEHAQQVTEHQPVVLDQGESVIRSAMFEMSPSVMWKRDRLSK